MRVAHVITRGDVGGAQTHVVELSRAQLERGDEVFIIAGSDGPAAERAREAGVTVRVVPALGRLRSGALPTEAIREVRSALADAAPAIVHGHSSHAGLIARVVARRARYRSVYTAHGWPFQAGAPRIQRVTSFCGEFVGGRLADAVICLTQAEAERARKWRVVPPKRLWVIPNGIAPIRSELVRRPHDGPVVLVVVARFAPPKRQADVVHALSNLTDLPWVVNFVGDGPQLDECRALGSRLLGDRARFLGHRNDVVSILATSDIAVLWSSYEGLPISLLEAMRAGLCCVGSDLDGVRELFGDPPCGIAARSSEDLTEALAGLIGHPRRIDELGAMARARFEDRFTVAAMEAATRDVYASVLERGSSAARW